MYVFFNFGMKFQGSKPEIEAPESKTYILHCKVYVFPIYTVKCMFFQFWNEISRFQIWNWSPKKFGMKFQGSKPEIEAPESKTYILHCKMYVFPILKWNFKIPSLKLKPQSQKYTFYTVKCMFLEGQLLEDKTLMHFFCQFLAISGKVKCMFLLFQMCVKKSMLFWRCFWGLSKKCVIQRVVFWEAQAGQGLGSGRAWLGLVGGAW